MLVVYRYRVKSLNGLLNTQARAVNYVWNFCNDTQKHALKWRKRWPGGFDLNRLTAGSCDELGLSAGTVNAVCEQYARSRSAKRKPYLRYRGRKNLGWVPFKGRDMRRHGDSFRFGGNTFRVFNSRDLPAGKIRDGGSFSQDSRGNWFLNIAIEVEETPAREPARGVGIDLGLSDFATLSTGEAIPHPRFGRSLEEKVGTAQRAGKMRMVKRIHARIANRRADFLHKLSARLVKEFDFIAVGDVSPTWLAKTKMAKSVYDASWSKFRVQLRYKALRHGAWYEEVREAFSSQVCSSCGALPSSRPKGIVDLRVRSWTCNACGASHDRDVNAALNILSRHGHVSPAEGTPGLSRGGCQELDLCLTPNVVVVEAANSTSSTVT